MTTLSPTSAELGAEAKTILGDAKAAAAGLADEAHAIATATDEPLAERADDAKALLGEAQDTARGLGADLGDLAGHAARAAASYADHVKEVVSSKLVAVKDGVAGGQEAVEAYVKRDPVRASLIAAAVGALLAQLLVQALRTRSRRL